LDGTVRFVLEEPRDPDPRGLALSVVAENDADAAAEVKDESAEGRLASGSMVICIVSQAAASCSGLALRVRSPKPPACPANVCAGGGVGTARGWR